MSEPTEKVKALENLIKHYNGRRLRIMEVCGTHTHEIFRLGIRGILPDAVTLISGPGCPVCVTPTGFLDEALLLAGRKATICTFGDLVRVPGTASSLAGARMNGAKVRMVYSPLDSVEYAAAHPEEQVVFLSVGFETTTPASCIAVREARERGLKNYSLLTANKTMENAYRALKDSVDAFLYPGHVSVITGCHVYRELLKEDISGVVTGFSGEEILTSLAVILHRCAEEKPFFENCYPRAVSEEGAVYGRQIIEDTMAPCDAEWRGLGIIGGSGLKLREEFRDFDARIKFCLPAVSGHGNPLCSCGDILQGKKRPDECVLFGKGCTPEHPAGACMVSNEGACSAYYKYHI